MPPLRRAAPTDPLVRGRLEAVLAPRGWVPPVAGAASGTEPPGVGGHLWPEPDVDAADAAGAADTAGAADAEDDDLPGRHRRGPAAGGGSVLDAWRGSRLDPGRRGLVVLAVVAVLAAGLAAVLLLRGRPAEVAVPDVVRPGTPVPGSAPAPGGAGGPSPGEVVVSVGGKVLRPGLLHLPTGSRVDDAVQAAGGAVPGADLTGLNLARRLVDGEQVLVGVPGAAPGGAAPPGAAGGAGGGAGGLLDLNSASAAELDALPGLGPVLAQRIVDWRTEHGRFGSVDQLREVGGIGESKYALIKAKVTV